MKKELNFAQGVRDGVPIGLGYLSVSFSFGLMAVRAGLPVWTAVLISASNLTSAGQVAGLSIIAAGGALIEMIVTQFVINMRYALMAVSLSQKADASFTTLRRMTAGTFLGAAAGNILPEAIKAALGIAIYGMFLAIIVPPAMTDRGAFLAALCAAVLSCCLTYIPALSAISQGFSVVICACAAAALAAWLHPIAEDPEGETRT